MSFKTIATLCAFIFLFIGSAIPVWSDTRVIPVVNKINCPDPCKGKCVFQDIFVVELKDKDTVKSLEIVFTRTVEDDEKCKATRDFKGLELIQVNEKNCKEVGDLKNCGIEWGNNDITKKPSIMKYSGEPLKNFKFKYTFNGTCSCGDAKKGPIPFTIDVEFKNGTFFKDGKEYEFK